MAWPLVLTATEGFMFKFKCRFKYTLARWCGENGYSSM